MPILFACPLYIHHHNKICFLQHKEQITKKCLEEIFNTLTKETSKNYIIKKIKKIKSKKKESIHN